MARKVALAALPSALLLAALASAAMNAADAAATRVYRWTDAQGGVHYDQVPPPNGRRFELVEPAPLRPPTAPSLAAPAVPGAAPADDGAKAFLKRAADEQQRREQARRQTVIDQAAHQADCEQGRQRLAFLDANPPNRLRVREADGNLRRLDAKEWEAQRQTAAQRIAEHCSR